jgi:hypothetical protein
LAQRTHNLPFDVAVHDDKAISTCLFRPVGRTPAAFGETRRSGNAKAKTAQTAKKNVENRRDERFPLKLTIKSKKNA